METSINEVLSLSNPNIIDIRSIEKYNNNHIPGAINVSSQLLMANPEKYLDKIKTYYIYCQRGITSRSLVQILRVKGYNAFSIAGGYEAWILNS